MRAFTLQLFPHRDFQLFKGKRLHLKTKTNPKRLKIMQKILVFSSRNEFEENIENSLERISTGVDETTLA